MKDLADGSQFSVSVTIQADPLSLSTTSLPSGTVFATYSHTLASTGGTRPYTWSRIGGTLPAGLSFSPSGTISGTPTEAGFFSLEFQVMDADGITASRILLLNTAAPTISVAPSGLPAGRAGTAYSQTVTASGGTAPYSFAITNGALPSGLAFSSSGELSGTPTQAGSFNFTVTATDSTTGTGAPYSSVRSYSGTVDAPTITVVPSSLPAGTASTAYSQTLTASGGTAPYRFAVASGDLPRGLDLSSSGELSGTPTQAGTFTFTVTATDSTTGAGAPYSGSRSYSFTIAAPTITVAPNSLPTGTTSTAYSQTVTASGGTAPYSFAVTSGSLPSGLALSSSGELSGTPTQAGTFNFDITATDSATGAGTPYSGSSHYSVTIAAPTITVAPSSLPAATTGTAYSQTVTASGGTAPYRFEFTSGALPSGLSLSPSGVLSGTPTQVGIFNVTVTATDANGATKTHAFTFTVVDTSISVQNHVISVPTGSSPRNVDLTSGATGGPFTNADIIEVIPANAGTASIVRGEFAGPTSSLGWYLKFIPKVSYSGTVLVRYSLSNAHRTSGTGVVTYSVGKVEDEMSGLVDGFVESRQSMIAASIKVPGLMDRRQANQSSQPVTTTVSPSEKGMTATFSTSLAQIQSARDKGDGVKNHSASMFNIWIDGSFLAHNRDENGDKWGSFGMVNLGADYLLSDQALLGLSFHYDMMSDPTKADAELTGNGWMAGPYASFELGQGVFWDTSLLYGGSSNDIDTEFWDGSFSTTRWMADSAIKGQWLLEDDKVLTPKLRVLYFLEDIADYTVTNAAGDVVTVNGFEAEQFRVSLGAELSRSFLLDDGARVKPALDVTGGYSGLNGSGLYGSFSAGVTMQTSNFWMLEASLLYTIEAEGQQAIGARVKAGRQF